MISINSVVSIDNYQYIDLRRSLWETAAVKTKRITANLPESLLAKALSESGLGITETLVAGLELLLQKNTAKELHALRGKIAVREDGGRSDGERRR